MGFAHGQTSGKLSEHLFQFQPNVRHRIRFLDEEPTSADVHQIPRAFKNKTMLRDFRTTLCRLLDKGQDECQSRFGNGNPPFWSAGQPICGDSDHDPATDPLWDDMKEQDRFFSDQEGRVDTTNEKDHFSIRRIHVIRVYEYDLKAVKVMRFGKQIFDVLHEVHQVRGSITAMDWSVIKNDKGRGQFGISYDATPLDSTKFKEKIDASKLKLDQFLGVIAQKDLGPFIEGELSFNTKRIEQDALAEKETKRKPTATEQKYRAKVSEAMKGKKEKTSTGKMTAAQLEEKLNESGLEVTELKVFLQKHAKAMGPDFLKVRKYTPEVIANVNRALDKL